MLSFPKNRPDQLQTVIRRSPGDSLVSLGAPDAATDVPGSLVEVAGARGAVCAKLNLECKPTPRAGSRRDGWGASCSLSWSSVVIDNIYVIGVPGLEAETQAPPVIDTNAPLSEAIAFECLQSVRRRDAQVMQDQQTVC